MFLLPSKDNKFPYLNCQSTPAFKSTEYVRAMHVHYSYIIIINKAESFSRYSVLVHKITISFIEASTEPKKNYDYLTPQ